MRFLCRECGRTEDARGSVYSCTCGGGPFELQAEWTLRKEGMTGRGVWRWRGFLPRFGDAPPVTLGEGGTPLVESPALAAWAGVRRLHVKVEGQNPTGSFKDRGMTVGVTAARDLGRTTVLCASTGNTSASLAAYAGRAGLRAVVLLPAGKTAAGKIAQAVVHGADVLAVEGDFDAAMRLVESLAAEGRGYLLNSLNPLRLEGQKTLVAEVVEDLGWRAPDRVVFPAGNAGNVSAAWKGLTELRDLGLLSDLPRLGIVQAEGAAPLARAWRAGKGDVVPEKAETIATAIRIGAPVNARKALRALKESDGAAGIVADAAILEARDAMARAGLFAEPASAASLAGLKALVTEGKVDRNEEVVCVATGHGLKDPDAVRVAGALRSVAADLAALRSVLP